MCACSRSEENGRRINVSARMRKPAPSQSLLQVAFKKDNINLYIGDVECSCAGVKARYSKFMCLYSMKLTDLFKVNSRLFIGSMAINTLKLTMNFIAFVCVSKKYNNFPQVYAIKIWL